MWEGGHEATDTGLTYAPVCEGGGVTALVWAYHILTHFGPKLAYCQAFLAPSAGNK